METYVETYVGTYVETCVESPLKLYNMAHMGPYGLIWACLIVCYIRCHIGSKAWWSQPHKSSSVSN